MSDRLDAAQEIAEGATQSATEPAGAPEGTTAPPEPTEPVSEPESGHRREPEHGGDNAVRDARREAAGHRVRAREAEAERDRLAARIERADRAEATRVAGEAQMNDPDDLWLVAELSRMRDPETGELDPARTRAEIDRVLRERPHWKRHVDFSPGVRAPAGPSGPSFGDSLKNAAGGQR